MAKRILGWGLANRPTLAQTDPGDIYHDLSTSKEYINNNDAAWTEITGSSAYATASDVASVSATVTALTARIAELEAAVRVTVTFNTDGGSSAPATQTIKYNTVATAPADPTKESKVFAGWFLPDATTAFAFTTKVKDHITLTAHWTDA